MFDGRDGKVRWTWTFPVWSSSMSRSRVMAFADFEGTGTRSVCVSFKEAGSRRRIVVLNGNGKERAHRDVVNDDGPTLRAGDLDGDGRDELLLSYGGLVHAWDRDLKELWFWPSRVGTVDQIVPASPGRPREVILRLALVSMRRPASHAGRARRRWSNRRLNSCPGCLTRAIRLAFHS